MGQLFGMIGEGGYNETGNNHTGLPSGTYFIGYEDLEHGCEAYDTVFVDQNDPINITFVDVEAPVCFEGSDGSARAVVDGGVPPYTYNWLGTGQTTAMLSNVPAGNYTVRVTDDDACMAENVVTIDDGPQLTVYYDVTDVVCHGENTGSVNVSLQNDAMPVSYDVTLGTMHQTGMSGEQVLFSNLDTGTYFFRVEDEEGCYYESDITISQPLTGVVIDTIIKTLPFCELYHDGVLEAKAHGGEGMLTYLWSDGEQGSYRDNLRVGDYTLTVEDANGCQATRLISLPYEREQCVEIPTAFSPNGDGVNDVWEIRRMSEIYPNCLIEVYDRWAQLIFRSKGYSEPWDGTYNGNPLPVNSYHFIIDFGDGSRPQTGQVTIVR